jgi:hypothetical protein
LIGVSGCLYAVRKSAYCPIAPALISDFVIAMKMSEQRLRTVLAPDAACFGATLDRRSLQLSMRVRAASVPSTHYGHTRYFAMLHRFSGWAPTRPTCFSFAKRRIPFILSCCLGSRPCSSREEIGFVLQGRHQELRIFGKPYYFYFLLTNLAALIAILRYVRGERMVTWKPIR